MFLALTPGLMLARGLVDRRGKARISAPTAPAAGNHKALVRLRELEDFFCRFVVVHNRSHRNFQHYIRAVAPGLVRTFAVATALPFVFGIETEVHQRIVALAGFHDDVAALAAVSARRAAPRHELLPPKGHAAIAAVPRLNPNFRLIDKHDYTQTVAKKR